MITLAFNDFLHIYFDKLPNGFHIKIFDHVKLPSTDWEIFDGTRRRKLKYWLIVDRSSCNFTILEINLLHVTWRTCLCVWKLYLCTLMFIKKTWNELAKPVMHGALQQLTCLRIKANYCYYIHTNLHDETCSWCSELYILRESALWCKVTANWYSRLP